MRRLSTLLLAAIALPGTLQAADAGDHQSPHGYFDETTATTLFAFDNVSIPFTQNLKLEMHAPQKHPANPVVRRGPDGACDSWAVQFYGSVIREPHGKFRMWYVAVSKAERLSNKLARSVPWRVAYAESDDGVHWRKPHLGLVESGGNTNNNLVRLEPHIGVLNLKVLFDADDPDPNRRYKMGTHVWWPKSSQRRNGTLAPFVSPDGLTWKLAVDATPVDAELREADTVIPALHFEPVGGLYKWDGLFYLSGQNAITAARPYHGRVSRTYISRDFVTWSQCNAIQFVRTAQHQLLGPGNSRSGEQTHEGISVWNRGNVLVGVSGMWHGTPEWKDLTIDLGFVLSNDGIQFREPAHEHIFLRRGDDGQWDQGGLLQGQGFENIGDHTCIYYGAWDPRNWQESPPRGGVGIATLPRDRFAGLIVDKTTEGPGDYQMPTTVSSFLTSSLGVETGPHRFFLNAEGLGEEANLKVELLDHLLNPLPKYSGKNAARVSTSGFQTPVSWSGTHELRHLPKRVRIRVTFEGTKKTDIRFSAIYMR